MQKISVLFLTAEEFNTPPVLTECIAKQDFYYAVAVCLQLSFHPDIK